MFSNCLLKNALTSGNYLGRPTIFVNFRANFNENKSTFFKDIRDFEIRKLLPKVYEMLRKPARKQLWSTPPAACRPSAAPRGPAPRRRGRPGAPRGAGAASAAPPAGPSVHRGERQGFHKFRNSGEFSKHSAEFRQNFIRILI